MNQTTTGMIRVAIIAVIIAGAFGALSVMAGGIGITSGKIFAICLSLILFGITTVICYVVSGKIAYKALGNAGMIVSILGFLVVAAAIIGEIGDEGIIKIAFSLFIASIALAHICLLHYFNIQNKWALYARITATIGICVFSLSLILRIFEPFAGLYSLAYDQSTIKVTIAALVIDLAATLLVPLCNRLPVNLQEQLILSNESALQQEKNGNEESEES